MSSGITASTLTDAVAPAARVALLAVRRSPVLIEVVPKVLVPGGRVQVSWSAAGSWSVTETLVAGPAPVLETVMVREAVSPGWIVSRNPGVTVLGMVRFGSSVTSADPWAGIWLLELPRFWASVKTTAALLVSGVGSPAWMARVSVKVKDVGDPLVRGGMLATVAVLLPVKAWMASASRLRTWGVVVLKVVVNELLGLFVSSTRLGLSDELVLVTV